MLKARDAILKMKEYHPPLSARRGMRLDFNENTEGCSPRVLAKLHSLTGEDLARYPERVAGERKVAAWLGVAAEQVLLTNGVDEAIHLLCETYLEPGDEVIIPVPTFGMYELYAQQTGARVVTVPAREDLAFPAERVLAAITARTRLIAIASPNNPTGAVIGEDDLTRVLHAAPEAAVLVDEAYYEFFGRSFLTRTAESPNLFVSRTFSKAFGLAGLRIGTLLGHIDCMHSVRKASSPYNVNGVALACLEAALEDEDYIRGYAEEIREGRQRLAAELDRRDIPYWKSEANFILLRVGEMRSQFVAGMRERGILVRDRNNDPGCAGCVRITIGTRPQMDTLLRAFAEVMEEIEIGAGER